MPKKYRLTGEEMKKISGNRIHGRFFSLLIARVSSDHPKFAVVVSKKTASKAVDRNKVKRRARSAMERSYKEVQRPAALVLYAKAAAKEAAYADILRDTVALFSRV